MPECRRRQCTVKGMAIEMGLGVSLRPHPLRSLVKRNVHRWLKPLRVATWVWIVMLTLSGWICGADAQTAGVEEPFRVMILRNTSQYIPAAILQDRGMQEAFAAKGPGRVEFFIETMPGRFSCFRSIARNRRRTKLSIHIKVFG